MNRVLLLLSFPNLKGIVKTGASKGWMRPKPYLCFRYLEISSKDVIRKLIFPVSVCCIYFMMENISAHRDLFKFIETFYPDDHPSK